MASLKDFYPTKTQTSLPASSGASLSSFASILPKGKVSKPKDKVLKKAAEPEPREVSLPPHLGGGKYLTSGPGSRIESERSQDVLGAPRAGSERDHIVPVFLGGTSGQGNLQFLLSPEGTRFGAPNRQEGKLSVELQAINDYKAGRIDLPEARARIAKKQQERARLIPEQGTLNYLPGAKAVKKVSGFFKNAFGNLKEAFEKTTSEADLTPEQRKRQREDVKGLSFLPPRDRGLVFEVGQGLKQEPITSGPIPSKRLLADLERGEDVRQMATSSGVFDIKTGEKVEPEGILPSSSEKGRALQMIDIQLDRARKDIERGLGLNAGKEFAKAIGRGAYTFPGQVATLLDWYAQNLQKDTGLRKEMQKKFGVDEVEKKTGEFLGNISKKISNWSERIVNETEVFPIHPAVWSDNKIVDDPGSKLSVLVGENIPTLALAIGITTATRNPIAGASSLGLLSGGQSFKEAREGGASIERANATGALVGIGETLLEIIPLKIITQGGYGSRVAKIGLSGISEASEEGVQTTWSNLVERWGYDKTRQWHQGVMESMLVGGITGGALGSVFSGTNQKAQSNAEKQAIVQGIVTKEQINALKAQIASQMIDKANEIDVVLQERIISTQDFGVQKPRISDFKEVLAPSQEQKTASRQTKSQKTVKNTLKAKEAQIEPFNSPEIRGLKAVKDREIELIKKGTVEHSSQKQSRLKAIGMQYSALQRKIEGRATTKEKQAARKFLESNHVGKKVDVLSEGKSGKVVGTAFGKIRVKFDNGTIKSIEPKNIRKEVVSEKQVQEYLRNQAVRQLEGGVFGDTFIFNKAKKQQPSVKPEKELEYVREKEPIEKFEGKVIDTTDYKDETLSRHYERVKEQYGFTDSVEYDKKTEKTEKKKAFDYIQRNPEGALRAGYGYGDIPASINPQVFRASLVASLMAQGKTQVAEDIAKIQSSTMTEAAQTLTFGRLDIGEEVRITRNITNERLKKIGEQLGEKAPEKQIERGKREVKRQANEQAKKVSEKNKNTPLKNIDNLIDSILC